MSIHHTVMKEEAVSILQVSGGDVVVDATANGGGHTQALEEAVAPKGVVMAFDQDKTACDRLKALPETMGVERKVIHANFRTLAERLKNEGYEVVDGVLFDLGWSSNQFEGGGKGFSFRYDEPLHMTYGDPLEYPFTAYDIVNSWEESHISDVIFGYGDERHARKIAQGIVRAREHGTIASSGQLSSLIEHILPRHGKLHPATKTFQAFRIAVNDEFGALKEGLKGAVARVKTGRRIAVITFHSGEDRIVKQYFRLLKEEGWGTLVTKKPVVASDEEQTRNPRSRSAQLRCIEKN